MTIFTHAYVGAVAYYAIGRWVGVEPGWQLPTAGAVIGTLPDTLDWLLAKLGLIKRWSLYTELHIDENGVPALVPLVIEIVLVAPWLHAVSDTLVHDPLLPEYTHWANQVMFRVGRWDITRRVILWGIAEVAVAALATILLLLV